MNFFYRIFNKNDKYIIPNGFTVTAHAGAEHTRANTLQSLSTLAESGVDIVEIDLNVSESGELKISHDTPTGSAPTFDEALTLLKKYENIRINIDVKKPSKLDKAQELILRHGMLDRVFYTGIKESFVSDVKEKSPLVPYYVNCYPDIFRMNSKKYCTRLVKDIIRLGGIGANIQFINLTPQFVKACHDRGLLVSAWTVNKSRDMKAILSMGADNITSKKPMKLRNLIR